MRALAFDPGRLSHEPAVLDEINRELERLSVEDRVSWALEHLPGEHALSSSFGAQAAVSLHLVTQQLPSIPVVLIDTGYLFPETYRFIDDLVLKLGLNLKVYQPRMSSAWLEARHGRLWEQGVDGIERYNELRKTEPMQRALQELGVSTWFAGLRRDQSRSRRTIRPLEWRDGRWKLHPIFDWTDRRIFDYLRTHELPYHPLWHEGYVSIGDWTDRQVFDYLRAHELPYHPLWHEGYVSIGDWHTTRSLAEAGDVEATRFFGLKRECGLHGLEG